MVLYYFMPMRFSLRLRFHWKMYLIRLVQAILLQAVSWDISPEQKIFHFENMKTAIIVGSAMASFCVEKFGPERLKEITKVEIDDRIQQFIDLVNFDIALV